MKQLPSLSSPLFSFPPQKPVISLSLLGLSLLVLLLSFRYDGVPMTQKSSAHILDLSAVAMKAKSKTCILNFLTL